MYVFKNTEINNKKASEFETKSLLYLIGMRSDSEEIEIVTVDCFNDVTGSNADFSKLWDVQSKNHASLPPSKIGESLYTLYKNHISSFKFHDYILFIPKLKREYLIDESLSSYKYKNIKEIQRKRIEAKLIEKINKNHSTIDNQPFEDFLEKVYSVEDNKKISTYIKKISKFKNKKSIPEKIYENIFNEIRNIQSSLKNSSIENKSISHPSEVIQLNRHIRKSDINTLLISRLIGIEVFSFPGAPISFLPMLEGRDEEDAKDILQECNENLSRAFFDKNSCKEFWKTTEEIINIVRKNKKISSIKIYDDYIGSKPIKSSYLTRTTLIYMISLVKTGIKDAN